MSTSRKQFWRYVRGLAAPLLLWSLFAAVLIEPLQTWLKGEENYDQAVLREWIEEARVSGKTLLTVVRDYLDHLDRAESTPARDVELTIQAESISEQLKSLGTPTLAYSEYLPLFPKIYSLTLSFHRTGQSESPPPIVWDSNLPRRSNQYQEWDYAIDPRATLKVQYQLHAYNKRRQKEQAAAQRLRWVSLLAVAGTAVAVLWIYLVQHRERERERQRIFAEQQVDRAEHLRLE